MGIVKPIHQRLAELRVAQKHRELNDQEAIEFVQCLDLNVKYCWEAAYKENIKTMESIIGNVNWENEIHLDEK